MKMRSSRILTSVAAVLAMAAAGGANATNGYFTHGVGTKSQALAGSGSADPQEILVIATNPAGLAFVDQEFELGLGLFSPVREYGTSQSQLNGQMGAFTIGPNDIKSENELFFIPHIAKKWQRGEQDSIALAMYARGGMNTEWRGGTATFDPDGPGPAGIMTFDGTYGGGLMGNAGTAGVDLMQAFVNLAYAHTNQAKTVSVGAAALVAAQRFSARGVAAFAGYTKTFAASGGTEMPTHLTNNGADMSYGFGGAVGLQWNPNDKFSLALGYTSKMSMSDFDKYKDLFAEGGGFDIPAQLDIGIAIRPTPQVTLTANVQEIYYEGVASVSNSISNIFACPTAGQGGTDLESCLGGKRGAGFGWQDMTVYKLGLAWKYGEDWTFRVGASTTDQPIPKEEMTFNILAPGVMEEHYTAGFTRKLDGGREFSVALMYAPSVTVTGPQNFDPTQSVEFKMHQWDLEFSYGWGR